MRRAGGARRRLGPPPGLVGDRSGRLPRQEPPAPRRALPKPARRRRREPVGGGGGDEPGSGDPPPRDRRITEQRDRSAAAPVAANRREARREPSPQDGLPVTDRTGRGGVVRWATPARLSTHPDLA